MQTYNKKVYIVKKESVFCNSLVMF